MLLTIYPFYLYKKFKQTKKFQKQEQLPPEEIAPVQEVSIAYNDLFKNQFLPDYYKAAWSQTPIFDFNPLKIYYSNAYYFQNSNKTKIGIFYQFENTPFIEYDQFYKIMLPILIETFSIVFFLFSECLFVANIIRPDLIQFACELVFYYEDTAGTTSNGFITLTTKIRPFSEFKDAPTYLFENFDSLYKGKTYPIRLALVSIKVIFCDLINYLIK